MGIVVNSFIPIVIFSLLLLSEVQGRPFSHQEANITIKTTKGQIYDCVDFYKQPAFSHPSLKHSLSKVKLETLSIQGERPPNDVALEGDGCPYGTVPILRVEVNAQGEDSVSQPPPPLPQAHCRAVVQTGNGKEFFGANGLLSINKPEVYKDGQWSAARIKLTNGPDSIEAGWMVNPEVFKDNEAHLYAKFSAGESGCINTDCPGFVHVGEKVPLGRIPEQYSNIGGQQYMWNISIDKHQDDGNWWLSIAPKKYQIGYWPKSLFTSLAGAASEVEWGGEINNPGPSNPPSDMGNSRKATYDTDMSAFVGHLTVTDESFNTVNPSDTVKYQDCEKLYTVLDFGYRGEYSGHLIVYGGGNPPN